MDTQRDDRQLFHDDDLNSKFKEVLSRTTLKGTMAEQAFALAEICRSIDESAGRIARMTLPAIFPDVGIVCAGHCGIGANQVYAYQDGSFSLHWFYYWRIVDENEIVHKCLHEDKDKARRFIEDPQGWDLPDNLRKNPQLRARL